MAQYINAECASCDKRGKLTMVFDRHDRYDYSLCDECLETD